MPWSDSLLRFGAATEQRYVEWAADQEGDPDADETAESERGTLPGYRRWVADDWARDRPRYVEAERVYRETVTFPIWFAENTWRPGPVKRPAKKAPRTAPLFRYAGVDLAEKLTYPDSSAAGGYRTVPVNHTSGTLGQFILETEMQRRDLSAWTIEVEKKEAMGRQMLIEAHGDRSRLLASLATYVPPEPEPAPALESEPV